MIYYTASTGTIIGGTAGSDLNGITHLPSGADYAIYVDDSVVNGLNPSNAPGTYSFTGVTAGPTYTVPTATGTLGFTLQSAADQLAAAQKAKKAQLTQSFNTSMLNGFTSTADGTSRTYAIDPVAMSKWTGALANINSGKVTTSIQVKDYSGNKVTLTPAQFQQMAADGYTFFNNQEQHLWSLEDQTDAATTVDAVNAISW